MMMIGLHLTKSLLFKLPEGLVHPLLQELEVPDVHCRSLLIKGHTLPGPTTITKRIIKRHEQKQ
uniref:Uncharacterized protein n=1 Tax=Meloidogyne enterolobii TaxID=390850 RepID=A0A6V7Y9Z6_MELEN|nr:unnamed protein product [Meloidogyne enterolobii]